MVLVAGAPFAEMHFLSRSGRGNRDTLSINIGGLWMDGRKRKTSRVNGHFQREVVSFPLQLHFGAQIEIHDGIQ